MDTEASAEFSLLIEGVGDSFSLRVPIGTPASFVVDRLLDDPAVPVQRNGHVWALRNEARGYDFEPEEPLSTGDTQEGDVLTLFSTPAPSLSAVDADAPPTAEPISFPAPELAAPPVTSDGPALAPGLGEIRHRRAVRAFVGMSKWALLLGVVVMISAIPSLTTRFWLWMLPCSATLAACAGTAVPRLLFPSMFGRWFEAAQAARDWLVVGTVTGCLYAGIFTLLQHLPYFAVPADDVERWAWSRFPFLVGSSALAIVMASRTALIAGSGLVPAGGAISAVLVVLCYALCTGWAYLGAQRLLWEVARTGLAGHLLAGGGVTAVLGLLGLVSSCLFLRSRGHVRTLPLEETLTLVGVKGVGKTTFLTMAYHALRSTLWGRIIVRGNESSERYIDVIYRFIDSHRRWPNQTLNRIELPFRLTLGLEEIVRFTWLDYAGGVVNETENIALRKDREAFLSRARRSKGVLLLVDALRLSRGDTEMLPAYIEVMRSLYRHYRDHASERPHLPPLCIALTKCDALAPRDLHAQYWQKVRPFVSVLEQLAREAGESRPRIRHFFTSAITQAKATGTAMELPEKGPLTSRNCAEVVLWMVAQALRGDHDLAGELEEFVGPSRVGSTILELERASTNR